MYTEQGPAKSPLWDYTFITINNCAKIIVWCMYNFHSDKIIATQDFADLFTSYDHMVYR